MKKFVLIGLALSLICGCGHKETEPPRAETPAAKEKNSVMLDAAAQTRIGLKTEALQSAQLKPEIKGYGRVVDPASLIAEAGDLEISKVANEASQAELNRLKTLAAQNNASARALQAAEVAAARDQAAFDAARLKLLAGWGSAISGRADLRQLVESLGKLESVLVRIDLPAGKPLENPASARIMTLDQTSVEGKYLGEIPGVDAQTQNKSFLFLIQPNSAKLAPGMAVTGLLPASEQPLDGVILPRSAIVRHEGANWVYIQQTETGFSRRLVSLAMPTDSGWFVTNGVSAGDKVVVTGVQTVFSEELSANGFNTGDRE